MREATTQTKRVELYWSMSGEIACVTHMPTRDSDTWVREAWTRMPDEVPWHEARCGHCDELCDACGVKLEDGKCPKCHVVHGNPCPDCGRRGYHVDACPLMRPVCSTCGGSGKRSTARSARGRELERHERRGTPCATCKGTGVEVAASTNLEVMHRADDALFDDENGVSDAGPGL